MNSTLHSVKLKDRTLWADGDSTVHPENILAAIEAGIPPNQIFVDSVTPEIEQYNRTARREDQIGVKDGIKPLSFTWNIPDEYKNLDVENYVICDGFDSRVDTKALTDEQLTFRIQRILDELKLYEDLQLMDVLRVLIYIINTLDENNVFWGVGRGSSVASYVLYCIGVHDIDSVKYRLNMTDFLRANNTESS